jgi:ABC-type lipoprotein release transport system permease subunit
MQTGLLVEFRVLDVYAESLLYGLQANDPRMLMLGCALLATTAAVASLIPAWRAARLDPAVVLRAE